LAASDFDLDLLCGAHASHQDVANPQGLGLKNSRRSCRHAKRKDESASPHNAGHKSPDLTGTLEVTLTFELVNVQEMPWAGPLVSSPHKHRRAGAEHDENRDSNHDSR
jgi:hypothetical protein